MTHFRGGKKHTRMILVVLFFIGVVQSSCPNLEGESQRCIKMAEPLIKEIRLVFPDNMKDLNLMCMTWNKFIDCLTVFMDKCYDEGQRRFFKDGITKPIESVHQMCVPSTYQKEYLLYAPCIKSTIVGSGRCGVYYNDVVKQVEQPSRPSTDSCCPQYRFKECALTEIRRVCDGGELNGPAVRLTTGVVNNVLSSTANCANYIPDLADCPIEEFNQITTSRTPKRLTAGPSEIPFESKMVTSWLPSSSPSVEEAEKQVTVSSWNEPSFREGRASSWPSVTSEPPPPSESNNITPNVDAKTSETSSGDHSTTWYPAAGNQLGDDVDEPNQLGLVQLGHNRGASCSRTSLALVFVLLKIFH